MNRLFCWGCGQFGQHGHEVQSTISAKNSALKFFSNNVKDVSCGASHTIVILDDDQIYAWGNGQNGQLGNGTLNHSSAHVTISVRLLDGEHLASAACGDRHSCLLTTFGNVYAFGCNFYGQLSFDEFKNGHNANQKIPKLISMSNKVLSVACGQHHTLMLLTNGTVVGVGRNIYGQVGVSAASNANPDDCVSADCVQVPQLVQFECEKSIVFISAGQNHSICIDSDGKPYIWGYGRACGLRQGHDMRPRCLTWPERVVEAAGGVSHSLLLTTSGVVLGLGSNMDGQLGLGEDQRTLFVTALLPLPIMDKVGQVSAGDDYSSFVGCSGQLYMCGRNSGVICADTPPGHHFFDPVIVDLGGVAVRRMVCGAWHAAILVEPTFVVDPDPVEVKVNVKHFSIPTHLEQEGITAGVKSKSCAMGIARERTIISLKDLYAATPSPRSFAHSSSSSFDNEMKDAGTALSSTQRAVFNREYLPANDDCKSAAAVSTLLSTNERKFKQPSSSSVELKEGSSKKKDLLHPILQLHHQQTPSPLAPPLHHSTGGTQRVSAAPTPAPSSLAPPIHHPIGGSQRVSAAPTPAPASLSPPIHHPIGGPQRVSAGPTPAPTPLLRKVDRYSIEQIDLIRLNSQRNDTRLHRSYTQSHRIALSHHLRADKAFVRRANSGVSQRQQEDAQNSTLERSLKMPRAITFVMERQSLVDEHENQDSVSHERKDNLHIWKREPSISIPSRFASVNLITRTL